MWVEQTKNGKFKFIERYEDILTGKIKRVSVTMDKDTPQTRKLALLSIQDKIEAKQIHSPKQKYTLGELVKLYEADQAISVKASTRHRNSGACKTLLEILGEDSLVERITSGYVRDRFLETKKGAGTLNELLKRFKALIRWGYQNELLENAAYLDKLVPFKDTPHKIKIQDKFLENSEFKKLIDGMGIDIWRLVTQFLCLSGLRIGEMIALEKADVDIKGCLIHVSKTFDAITRISTTPKTQCSIRDVYMQDELREVCSKLSTLMLRRKLMYNLQENTLFLFSEHGNHLNYDTYRNYLIENSLRILGRKVTPHALRHTHASFLLAQGVGIDSIQRRLGHENSKVTREIYLHITEELKRRDNEQIAKVKIL